MSNLSTNTASLQAILDTVNALPEAGSGSGGGVETCTVTVDDGGNANSVICQTYENGAYSSTAYSANGAISGNYNNVVKNSIFVILAADSLDFSLTGAQLMATTDSESGEYVYSLLITDDATIVS